MSTDTPAQKPVNYHQEKRKKIAAAVTAWQHDEEALRAWLHGDADPLDDFLREQGLQILPTGPADARYRVLIDGQSAPYIGQTRPSGPMEADEAVEVFLVAALGADAAAGEHRVVIRPATDDEMVRHAIGGDL
ncbi:hypothetical protein [Streptosporangium sp. NPDC002721]|uniref:hypothetical protein n=1 Tax=Streptosporangium sp. NPDC002721 TaxID=3366188 RepID=UPI0036B06CA1